MRRKIYVFGRAFLGTMLVMGSFAVLSLSQANTQLPMARPDIKVLELEDMLTAEENRDASPRPTSRPDALYKAIIFADVETLVGQTEQPKLVTQSSTTVLPTKRPSAIQRKVDARHRADSAASLSLSDRSLYTRIFEIQKSGQWDEADRLSTKLDNKKLMGHVYYQRYMHPTKYRSQFNELSYWLDRYGDHPNAQDIYKLAVSRQPANYKGHIAKPKKNKKMRGSLEHQITDRASRPENKKRSKAQSRSVRQLYKTVNMHLHRGQPTLAKQKFNASAAKQYMNALEQDSITARIAASYLYEGKPDMAAQLASTAWNRSQSRVPLAGWVAGLTSWMKDDYISAASYFTHSADSAYANGWLQSASAYWAARSYKKLRNTTNHQKWLLKAASHPRTFYGLIAARSLGKNALSNFNWSAPDFTAQHAEILKKIKNTNRAMALVESGQHHLAELEFRQIYPGANDTLKEAMLAYALNNGLPSFALRFGNTYKADNGKLYDAALYPVGGWKPKNGYQLDKALIHAFIRQESEFNPTAENPSGATGLMQLMPRTATYVAGDQNFNGKLGRYLLKDPKENLEIGQKYIQHLINQSAVSRDLFSLAIAYNAGPGNLRKWKKRYSDIKDPLLFVELIPVSETRSFVERVMRNLWIYRQRMNQPTPSLDNVASGHWARYVQLDSDLPFDVALSE